MAATQYFVCPSWDVLTICPLVGINISFSQNTFECRKHTTKKITQTTTTPSSPPNPPKKTHRSHSFPLPPQTKNESRLPEWEWLEPLRLPPPLRWWRRRLGGCVRASPFFVGGRSRRQNFYEYKDFLKMRPCNLLIAGITNDNTVIGLVFLFSSDCFCEVSPC